MITTKTGDTYTTKIKSSTSETVSTTVVSTHSRHSLQEGVRMIVTPLVGAEPKETAIVSPPIDVHRAVTVRNNKGSALADTAAASSTSKMFAAIATNHLKALGALQDLDSTPSKPEKSKQNISSSNGNRSTSSNNTDNDKRQATSTSAGAQQKKTLGRHKTIVECSAGTSTSSNGTDDSRLSASTQKKTSGNNNTKNQKRIEKNPYGSPESPLSKMNVMPNPTDELEAAAEAAAANNLPTPKNIAALTIPTPERLLPIGSGESVAALVDRVREGLNLPDISHLKQDSLDVSDSTKDDVTPSSRTQSPRRLIKQVALESPPNANAPTTNISTAAQDLHSSILKTVQQDTKTATQTAANAAHRIAAEAQKRPRQKLAPFNVDSNAIPDIRSRYAGSWPPPPYRPPEERDEDEAEEGTNGDSHENGFGPQFDGPNRPVRLFA